MNTSVRDFLGCTYNHGNSIKIVNNIPSYEEGPIHKTLWEDKFESMDNYIPDNICELDVVKWGIENEGIVIYVDYEG